MNAVGIARFQLRSVVNHCQFGGGACDEHDISRDVVPPDAHGESERNARFVIGETVSKNVRVAISTV